jgi:hypothetical protein
LYYLFNHLNQYLKDLKVEFLLHVERHGKFYNDAEIGSIKYIIHTYSPSKGIHTFLELRDLINKLNLPLSPVKPFGSNRFFYEHVDDKDFVEQKINFKGIKNYLYFFKNDS